MKWCPTYFALPNCLHSQVITNRVRMWEILLQLIILLQLCSPLIWRSLICQKYRVIHKSLQDFRPLRYSSRDGHAEWEHANRGRDTPSFCPNLQVLDMSTLGDAADVNPVIKFLPHTCKARVWQELDYRIDILTSAASPRVDISSTCKVGQKIGVSLPLLTCSPSAWPSRLLYRRGRKFRSDLWITLYNVVSETPAVSFVD